MPSHCTPPLSLHTPQAIFVPADDLTDPAPATTFAHLDATTVLSRAISELGIYPAVDPLDSTSRIMDPNIVGQEHYNIARSVQKILQVWMTHAVEYMHTQIHTLSWVLVGSGNDVIISVFQLIGCDYLFVRCSDPLHINSTAARC